MEVPDFPPEDLGRPKRSSSGLFGFLKRRKKGPGVEPIQIGDPLYDEWPVLREYEDAATARSFLQAVREAGLAAVLTSDWPLDRFGRGDIALRVPPGDWSEAEEFMSGLDLE